MANAPLRLAENLVLLQKLSNQPIPPSKNKLVHLDGGEGRTLEFRQELDIAECLTYLSAYSNDPERVLALCLEEQTNHQGLVVSIATNTGPTSHLQRGIQSARESGHILLLRRVFAHGRARLRRRLGFQNQITTAARLKDALAQYRKIQPRISDSYRNLYALSDEFYCLSLKANQASSENLCSLSEDSLLISILSTVSKIWGSHRHDIDNMLEAIPKIIFDNDIKDQLKSRLGHLGRYIPASYKLIRSARRFTIFCSIEVRSVYLPPLDIAPYLKNKTPIPETGLLNRYLNYPKSLKKYPDITVAMQMLLQRHPKSLAVWQQEIRQTVMQYESQKTYKVHAEIQLLLDYERRDDVAFPPRVLKSSKSACFLCNLFIKIHGGFYTPKTHGRLYDPWILPCLDSLKPPQNHHQEIGSVVEKFNAAVEELILQSVLEKKRRIRNPRESDIFSLASSIRLSTHSSIATITEAQGEILPADAPETTLIPVSLGPSSGPQNTQLDGNASKSPTSRKPSNTSIATPFEEIESIWSNPEKRNSAADADRTAHYVNVPSPTTLVTPTVAAVQVQPFGIDLDKPQLDGGEGPESPILPPQPLAPSTTSMPEHVSKPPSAFPRPSLSPDPPGSHRAPPSSSPPINLPRAPLPPESPASLRRSRIIYLQPDSPQYRTFTPITPPTRFHTPKIHIEVSYSGAQSIFNQSHTNLRLRSGHPIRVQATLLERLYADEVLVQHSKDTVDLGREWRFLELKEGILFNSLGLLLRKGEEVIRLKAEYWEMKTGEEDKESNSDGM
ncbi:hypothetical protein K469DRAFT_686228 [Zopfia rhizophila CBS 207.26]|uniref:Uncharacterized protein n=1 Tax=Zopfia rhizophila CBS 207.26 TaxID=1314779 RepID=A0A6A6E7L7_9PEZI|nr:hypothetical protein K469DRAFT_686228 [Zopfia rhizophila CBS 207.26]